MRLKEKMGQSKKRKITKLHVGITVLVVVKVAIIISLVYLAYSVILLKQEIQQDMNQTRIEIQDQILTNQQMTQSQINEIRKSLLITQTDLTDEINELRAETSADFSGIIADVIKSVVSVGTDISQGSGFIIDEEGYIITNVHVLTGATYAQVLTYEDERWVPAELVGYNEEMDVAILKISGNYEVLEFADSEDINIGEKAVALGNPLGLSFSVSEGIVSAKGREGPNGLPVYLQIDTALNSGNSGGPLINKRGEVIGINNFKIAGGESLGFALESNAAVETINAIFDEINVSVSV